MDAAFFVGLGFLLFIMLLGYLGVFSKITKALDDRAADIGNELAEAKRLRDEASALLASFAKKKADAEAEAAGIVAQAKLEAESLAKEAQERIAEFVTRRTKQAEQKIALAEAQATQDVRAAAADVATKAAEIVLRAETAGAGGGALIAKGIEDVKKLLN